MRVLITGSTGLGAVVAEAFKEHDVVVIGRNRAMPYDHQFNAVIHTSGGGLGYKNPMLSEIEFYRLFQLNVGYHASINRLVLPHMIERRSGYICHICSIASGEAVGSVGYNTVKASLSAYVRGLGREMAAHGIVVSGIAPGGFRCEGNAMDRLAQGNAEAYNQFIKDRLPRGRMGDAQELIPLIKLLTSPAGSMMAGCVVPIDAGEGRYYTT